MSFSLIRAATLAVIVAAAALPGCGQQPAGAASKPAIDPTSGGVATSRPVQPGGTPGGTVAGAAADGAASRPESRAHAAQLALDVPGDTRDAVLDGMRSVVRDLMLKGFVAGDKAQLMDRLVAIFESASLGDAPRRALMAKDLAAALLDVPIAARKKPGSPLTADEEISRERVAQALAKDVYARIKPVPAAGAAAPTHTGVLRAVADQPVPFGFTALSWKVLGGFEYSQGMKLPEPVAKLAGQKVGISGYIMTIDEVENIHEFLLVESLWTCCSGTPPNVNQVIVVRIPGKKGIEYSSQPVHVLGTLEVGEKMEDGFVSSVYRLTAGSVKVIE